VPPFNDIRVRRALNLALDRTRIVNLRQHAGRPGDLPNPSPRDIRLPPILPVHQRPDRRRPLARA
jgi:ABC-type transport system substrate-binding protein